MVYCFPTDIFLFEVLFEQQLVNLDVCDKVFLIFLLLSEFQYTTDICQQLCGSLSVACPCNICKHHRRTKKIQLCDALDFVKMFCLHQNVAIKHHFSFSFVFLPSFPISFQFLCYVCFSKVKLNQCHYGNWVQPLCLALRSVFLCSQLAHNISTYQSQMMSDLDIHVPSTYQLSKCCKRINLLKSICIYSEYLNTTNTLGQMRQEMTRQILCEGNSQFQLIQPAV